MYTKTRSGWDSPFNMFEYSLLWKLRTGFFFNTASDKITLFRTIHSCVLQRLVHHYDTSISTRESTCKPERCKHKRKHRKKELFPSSCACACACACACVAMSYVWTGTRQAQAQDWKGSNFWQRINKQINAVWFRRSTAPAGVQCAYVFAIRVKYCISACSLDEPRALGANVNIKYV